MLLATAIASAMTPGAQVSSGPRPADVQWKPVTMQDLITPKASEWPTWGRTGSNLRYSPLTQIHRNNVSRLGLRWALNLGFDGAAEFSPVVVNGIMFIGGNSNTVLALDATNGEKIWEYKSEVPAYNGMINISRGVAVYDDKVYFGRLDAVVVALDAKTGKEVWKTTVDDWKLGYSSTSPPLIANGKVVIGTTGADLGGANGLIVGLDAKTGDLLWKFNTIPGPGEPGHETWEAPGSWEHGGGSPWNVGSYDHVTNTVIYGTGNPTPWLSTVRPGDNLYTNTLVGLDADTGKLKWYYQVTPGDQWDYDEHTTPMVINLNVGGKTERTIVHFSKNGWFQKVDPTTGKFLDAYPFTVHDVIQGFDANGRPKYDPDKMVKGPDEEGEFCPSLLGGTDWMLGAYSPDTGLVYMPTNDACMTLSAQQIEWKAGQAYVGADWKPIPAPGYDNIGNFQAIDPVTGKQVWSFKTKRGWSGGAVVTGGGLVFAGTMDRTFRAFDAKTGEVLWQQILGSSIESHPISYEVNGTQYIAVASGCCSATTGALAGMTPELGFPPTGGATMYVFALPNKK